MPGSSTHQPDLLVSCTRRTASATYGTMVASVHTTLRMVGTAVEMKANMPPMMLRAMLHSTKNRMTHQNSRREARPENTAYFVKKRLTALPKVQR